MVTAVGRPNCRRRSLSRFVQVSMNTLIASAVALFAFFNAGSSAGAAQDSWSSGPPMRYTRAAHAVVSDGQSIYALAGTGTGGVPVVVFERFDGKVWRDEGAI